MKSVVIGFSRAKSPLKIGSRIIAEAEKRPYSHVYVRVDDTDILAPMIYQASHGFVNCLPFTTFLERNVVVKEYEFMADDSKYTDLLVFLKKSLGIPYSYIQMLAIAVRKVLHLGVEARNGDTAYICSELGSKVANILGIKIEEDLDIVTPSDLDRLLNDAKIEVNG